MSFSRIAENRIREAIERGEFDNLPGSGQPLSLEEYFSTPEDVRLAHSPARPSKERWAAAALLNANCAGVNVVRRPAGR